MNLSGAWRQLVDALMVAATILGLAGLIGLMTELFC